MGATSSVPPPPLAPVCRPQTSLLYALAVVYLLFGLLIIIMAVAIPGLATTPVVAFAVVGGIVFIAALLQIIYTSRLAVSGPPVVEPPPAALVPPP